MIKIDDNNKLIYITDDNEFIKVAFSTVHGGVSTGECYSMNMSYNRNDTKENVDENFKILLNRLGLDDKNLYMNHQMHGNKVRVIKENDRNTYYSDEYEYDAMVTNSKNAVLTAIHADCIPILLLDSENMAIGAVHSGWKGTVKEIVSETVKTMNAEYSSKPENIKIWIGPGICKECFLVREDVYKEFAENKLWQETYCKYISEDQYSVDLKGIIKNSLTDSGIPEENIKDLNICTSCNEGLFYSHRRDKGKTGAMTAIISLC